MAAATAGVVTEVQWQREHLITLLLSWMEDMREEQIRVWAGQIHMGGDNNNNGGPYHEK